MNEVFIKCDEGQKHLILVPSSPKHFGEKTDFTSETVLLPITTETLHCGSVPRWRSCRTRVISAVHHHTNVQIYDQSAAGGSVSLTEASTSE